MCWNLYATETPSHRAETPVSTPCALQQVRCAAQTVSLGGGLQHRNRLPDALAQPFRFRTALDST